LYEKGELLYKRGNVQEAEEIFKIAGNFKGHYDVFVSCFEPKQKINEQKKKFIVFRNFEEPSSVGKLSNSKG